MPLTILDLVVIGVIGISALLAAVRGFTREVLSIASWVAAAAVAWIFHPALMPHLQPYIPNKTAVLVASIAALFLVTLIIVSLITARISDFVLDSRIGALDRSLGFGFGVARGLLLCVIGYLFFANLMTEKNMPAWARDAKSKSFLEESGKTLMSYLPTDIDSKYLKNLIPPKSGDPAEPAETQPTTPRRS
jgi:membrane protein required for colicin V production